MVIYTPREIDPASGQPLPTIEEMRLDFAAAEQQLTRAQQALSTAQRELVQQEQARQMAEQRAALEEQARRREEQARKAAEERAARAEAALQALLDAGGAPRSPGSENPPGAS